jgi:hypothetical protein
VRTAEKQGSQISIRLLEKERLCKSSRDASGTSISLQLVVVSVITNAISIIKFCKNSS